MAKIGSLIAELGLDSAKFEKGVKTAQSSLGRFASTVKRRFDRLNRAMGRIATGMVVAYAAAFTAMTANALRAADQIAKLSTRLGAGTEALSQYRHMAEQSGVAFNTFTMGLQRMTRRVSEAAVGTGEAEAAILELGLSAKKLAQLAPEDQFMVIAQAIHETTNEADKVRLAMKLFDSEGVALLQTMKDGKDGIIEYRKEAHELGLTLTEEDAVAAETAMEAIGRLKNTMNAAAQESAINLVPAINLLADQLAGTIPMASEMAAKSFLHVQKFGLQVAASLTRTYSRLAMTVSDLLRAAGLDDLADQEGRKGQFAAMLSKNLMTSAGRTSAAIAEMSFEMKTFGEATEEAGAKIKKIAVEDFETGTGRMSAEMARTRAAAKELGESFQVNIGDKSRSVFQQMEDQFKQALINMVNAWLTSNITGLFNTVSSGGGLAGSAFKLFGFNNGGSFEVGGRGGIDQNVVAFRASKGERVDITPANETRKGGGGGITFVNHYDMRGSTLTEAQVDAKVRRGQDVTVAHILEEKRKGRL